MSRTFKDSKNRSQLFSRYLRRASAAPRFLHVGPGGVDCPCCFPAPGKRRDVFKKARRAEAVAHFASQD